MIFILFEENFRQDKYFLLGFPFNRTTFWIGNSVFMWFYLYFKQKRGYILNETCNFYGHFLRIGHIFFSCQGWKYSATTKMLTAMDIQIFVFHFCTFLSHFVIVFRQSQPTNREVTILLTNFAWNKLRKFFQNSLVAWNPNICCDKKTSPINF